MIACNEVYPFKNKKKFYIWQVYKKMLTWTYKILNSDDGICLDCSAVGWVLTFQRNVIHLSVLLKCLKMENNGCSGTLIPHYDHTYCLTVIIRPTLNWKIHVFYSMTSCMLEHATY